MNYYDCQQKSYRGDCQTPNIFRTAGNQGSCSKDPLNSVSSRINDVAVPPVYTPSACMYGQPSHSNAEPEMSTMQKIQMMGSVPMTVRCPNCGDRVFSTVTYENNIIVHCSGLLMFLLICGCCIPYLINSLKDVHHMCPKCFHFLGVYKRF